MVTGASGLVGGALVPTLTQAGHEVIALVRRPPSGAGERQWDPHGELPSSIFEGADAVIHLAGESIAAGRWTVEQKRRILDSRKLGTERLCRALVGLARKPAVLISASAIGYYGDRGDEMLTETSASGTGFLPEVARAWEDATKPAAEAGIRVVLPRIGVVLSTKGGALGKMLLPFRMGAGGRVGSGRQWMSWIHIGDLVAVISSALTGDLRGTVNAVAPNPVSNADFTRILGEILHRPTILPMPALAVKLVFGEMGQELLLGSQRVLPERLQQAEFSFRYATLKPALKDLLG